ncbi:adhesin transport system outer membrane protein [Rhizobium sp. PP-CC-3A-592]|nr:adhesin transport system outer membrane protein [Rhizobium sp. PP-CC-3A-592]
MQSRPSLPQEAGGTPLAAIPVPASSEGSAIPQEGPITIEDAVWRAIAWSPAITQAAGLLGESHEEINVAKAGYYPKIGGGLSSALVTSGSRTTEPAMNISVSQMVYDFGKVANTVEARTAGSEVSHARMLQAVDQVIRDTSQAMVEVQRNTDLLHVARQQLAGVQAIAGLVTQRTDSGAATRSDKVQAAARVQAAEATVLEVSSALGRWESALASLLGVEGRLALAKDTSDIWKNACDSGMPNWNTLPGVLEADAGRRQAVAERDLTRSEIYPTLSLKADGSYALAGTPSDTRNPDFSIGFNLSGNFSQGGAAASRSKAAGFAVAAAEAARETAKYEAGRALSEARAQISGLKQLATSLSSRSAMMIETRDLYREQYLQLGTRTLLDLLNAEEELHTARFDAVNTNYDLRRLATDCLFNSGGLRDAFGLSGKPLRGVII